MVLEQRSTLSHRLDDDFSPLQGDEERLAFLPLESLDHLARNGYSELPPESLQPHDFEGLRHTYDPKRIQEVT